MTYFDQVSEAAAFLKSRIGTLAPAIGIVLGSGLGAVADAVSNPTFIPYAEMPSLPAVHGCRPLGPHRGRVARRHAGRGDAGPRAFL